MKRLAVGIILIAGAATSVAHDQFGAPWDYVPKITVISSAGDGGLSETGRLPFQCAKAISADRRRNASTGQPVPARLEAEIAMRPNTCRSTMSWLASAVPLGARATGIRRPPGMLADMVLGLVASPCHRSTVGRFYISVAAPLSRSCNYLIAFIYPNSVRFLL